MIYEIARPLLFALDPEDAHRLTLHKLEQAHRLGLTRWVMANIKDDPVEVFGLTFRNPVGLAAGLDKNATHVDAFGQLGFGFVEVGTVTPRPQPGNAKPRMFRLPDARALINRLGFNNDGLANFLARVKSHRVFSAQGGVLGLNIGKNADTPIDRALDDYLICLREVYPLLIERPGYITVNISSPNTRDLRSLQAQDQLTDLLVGLREERHRLADRYGKRVPMAVKIAPDLDDAELPRVADTAVECEVDAIIATNTTIARDRVTGLPNATQAGGLSGAPLSARSTAVINALARHLRGRLPIIGVGGIMSGADAVAKIEAGASLVQLYTGLIYRGPALVAEMSPGTAGEQAERRKMERIELGTSGLKVSPICLGTMTFGQQNTEAQGHAQLDYAVERGINFIDTAEMYPVQPRAETYGATEKIIGSWLKRQPRDRLILATKVAGPSRGMDWMRDGKLDTANIRTAIEGSLKRLGTDYIDLYQIHWPGRNVPMFGQNTFDPNKERPSESIEELLATLAALIRAGKIRHIGVSNESAWGVCEFAKVAERDGLPRIASIQNAYHLMNRSFEQALDEVCFRAKVSLLAYSPLAFGQLSAKYVDDAQASGRLNLFPKTWSRRYVRAGTYDGARRYGELARANGMSPATLALAWCYSRWFVASTIIGATSVDQLRENIDAYTMRLGDDVVATINKVHAELTNPAQ